MRRSGTTILFDALLEDEGLRCFYEPLREGAVTEGGGSGAREGDAFAAVRALRDEFRAERHPELRDEDFNWGGPRDPGLELEPELPDHCREWLAWLLDRGPEVAIKETRLAYKVSELTRLSPDSALIHVVRDPRDVAASIVLGRERKRLAEAGGEEGFFEYRSDRPLWSSREISERLLADRVGWLARRRLPDYKRVLAVWGANFAAVEAAGALHFGERYLVVRNEDLRSDPGGQLGRIYALIGREAPAAVREWATANVRAPSEPFASADPRWGEAISELGISAEVTAAGYVP
jgi:hypothetical protein